MNIEITKEQLKEMILAAMFYSWIRGGLADSKGEDFSEYEKLEKYLLQVAKENKFDLAEEFKSYLVPTDQLCQLQEKIMEEHDEDTFWHELVTALGKRDFYKTITDTDKQFIEKEDMFPERIHQLYEKYEEEFDKFGIDRLEIKKDNH